MSTLHIVNKSPFSHATVLSCLQVCAACDEILFIEDGVYCAMKNSPYIKQLTAIINSGVKIYALNSDINARGLREKLHSNVSSTDYNGFVKLSIQHQRVQSWY